VVESNKWDPEDNHSGYAITKYLSENEVWRGIEEGLNAVIINPSVIIGPGNWNESSLSIFKTLSNGLQFYTAGANAFVDVRDVVNAMQRLVSTTEAFGQRYLCTGTNVGFKQLFEEACVYMNRKPPRFFAGKVLSVLAWRISALLSLFTGKQTVTKDSARSAQAIVRYDSKKLSSFLSFEFTDFKETVKHTVEGRIK
jgi:nucleoside-diphosphate-sugar epimerase